MNRAAQAASGRPSGIGVCELAASLASGAIWYRGSTLWSLDDILRLGAMSEEITFQDITGEPVSGRFEVSEGLITVTLPDGRKTTADIEESMLSPEILARVLLLQLHRAKQPNATSEDLPED